MNYMPAAGEKIRGLINDSTNEHRSKNQIQGHSWGQGEGFYNGQKKIVFILAQDRIDPRNSHPFLIWELIKADFISSFHRVDFNSKSHRNQSTLK